MPGMRAIAGLLGLCTLAVPGARAVAGPYLGLGVGTAPTLGDSMQPLEPTSRCGLVGLGQRLGPLALEAGLSGYELQRATAEQGRSLSAFGGGKLYVELEGQLEAFARGGVERTWLSGSGAMADYQGDGAYVGIGAELRLALPLGQTSLWVDYTRHQATLRAGVAELDASAGRWTVGLSIGL